MSLVVLFVVASATGLFADRIGIPGGLILGAMFGAAAVQLVRGGVIAVVPGPVQTAAYLAVGTSIGATMTRDVVLDLRHALVPALLSAVILISAGLGVALLLRVLSISVPGDVLATSPGAMSAIVGVAAERGKAAPQVALFHTVRVILVMATLPLLSLVPRFGGS